MTQYGGTLLHGVSNHCHCNASGSAHTLRMLVRPVSHRLTPDTYPTAIATGTVAYAQLAVYGNIAVKKQCNCRSEAHAAHVIGIVLFSI